MKTYIIAAFSAILLCSAAQAENYRFAQGDVCIALTEAAPLSIGQLSFDQHEPGGYLWTELNTSQPTEVHFNYQPDLMSVEGRVTSAIMRVEQPVLLSIDDDGQPSVFIADFRQHYPDGTRHGNIYCWQLMPYVLASMDSDINSPQ